MPGEGRGFAQGTGLLYIAGEKTDGSGSSGLFIHITDTPVHSAGSSAKHQRGLTACPQDEASMAV